ncbi:DUF4307 domain-containing protein [Nocardioidaceae bacterium]|nr:DUF4307 domain-containing protein [Nocardioidaceae bacterium]
MTTMDPGLRAERYGAPQPGRRRLLLVLVGLGAAVGLGWLAWVAVFHAVPEVRSELRSYEILSPDEATASVLVDRADDGVEATCIVQAYGEDHSAVGQRVFTLGPGEPEDATFDVAIRTERPAVQVVATGCTAPGQPRAR